MAVDCRGQFFAQQLDAKCDAVKAQCGYGSCNDSIGEHCYGIDPSLGYKAGQYEPRGTRNCTVGTFCPLAFDEYYHPDTLSVVTCCPTPGKLMSCHDGYCYCKELKDLESLAPLPQPSSIAGRSSSVQTPTASTSPTNTSATSTSTSPQTSGGSEVPKSGGLNTGAKVGIAVGTVLGAAALFGLAFWLAWRLLQRRRNGGKAVIGDSNNMVHEQQQSTLEVDYAPKTYGQGYRHPEGMQCAQAVQELDGRHMPVEAGGRL